MFGWLLLLFVTMPVVELYLLIRVGAVIGAPWTILLVIGTGILGSFLVRQQGTRVLMLIRADLAAGRMPAERILSGLLILVGGVLLLTPGILTDCAGFLLMVPGNRRLLIRHIGNYLQSRIDAGTQNSIFIFRVPPDDPSPPPR